MIFIVIPVHNRLAMTRACLASLEAQSRRDFTVYLVDDGSTDGTYAAIAADNPQVRLLQGDGNLWWAGSVNGGIEAALSVAAPNDYILTFNNDTEVKPDYLASLMTLAAEHPGALIGSVAVSMRRHTIVDGGTLVNWVTAKHHRLHVGEAYAELLRRMPPCAKVSVLSGRGTLIPVRTFRTVGLFDNRRLPHYGADYEFSRRADRAGFPLLVSYRTPVYVHEHATGVRPQDQRLTMRQFFGSLTSIRSPSNLGVRFHMALLCAERWAIPFYLAADVARTWGSAAWRQARLRAGSEESRR